MSRLGRGRVISLVEYPARQGKAREGTRLQQNQGESVHDWSENQAGAPKYTLQKELLAVLSE